jgi:protein CpxP
MEKTTSYRKYGIAGLVLSILAVTTASVALAWGPRGPHRDGEFAAFMLERMLERVDATDEQQQQITTIFERTHEDIAALREGIVEDPSEEILTLLSAPTVDPDALEQLRVRHTERLNGLSQIVVASVVEASQVLTAEQRSELATAFQERFENAGGFRGRGRHFGPRHW